MKYVIVGGVAGGATAAARIRRNTEKAEIILLFGETRKRLKSFCLSVENISLMPIVVYLII